MQKMVLLAIATSVILIGIIWTYVGDMVAGDSVNMLSMIAAVIILALSVGVAVKYINQMKTDKATGELAEENWDGIGEYKNELPIGWAVSFIGVIVWALWYMLSGYPVWAYSQIGEWNEETKAHSVKFESKYSNADSDTLTAMGESVFLVQCAPCHGISAEGLDGKAQNLVKWGKEESIVDTIMNGSEGMNFPLGMMPPLAGMVTQEQAKAIAAYVVEKLTPGKSLNPSLVAEGEQLYSGIGTCNGCHGDDGKGMGAMAPDLTNLAGAALNNGKKGKIGTMPSFNDGRLTNTQKKALNNYVYSLSE